MTNPCIISVAITGSLPRKKDNPAVPVTVSEQVESTHAAYEAGAALVHLHVRNDDETPTSAPERFATVLDGIRKHCPLIITQVSTGGRSGAGRERGGMLHLRPDMASLAPGSVNFPTRVYDNAPDLVDWLAGRIAGPLHIQFVMGIKNAMPVDREVFEFYVKTLNRLAPGATWTGAGIGKDQLTLAKWSLELGGHCRTGLEDNVRLDRDTLAPSNASLVAQISGLCERAGRRVATPQEARSMLQLSGTPQRRSAAELHAAHVAHA